MIHAYSLSTPPLGPAPIRTAIPRMRVLLDQRVALPSPWVAYEMPWHAMSRSHAGRVADALDSLGIAVAGLASELASGDDKAVGAESRRPPVAICPYRGDRYGLELEDLRGAKIIDVRLAHTRGTDGLTTYSSEQMRRWDTRAAKTTPRDHVFSGAMNAICWPPDVSATEKLASKVAQLSALAPAATVCISIGADHLQHDLPHVIASGAQIVALRMENWPVKFGDSLADRVAWSRDFLDAHSPRRLALLIVPPPASVPEDYIKLLALGADLVALDGLCINLAREPKRGVSAAEWAATNLGVLSPPLLDPEPTVDATEIEQQLKTLRGLVEMTGVGSVAELGRHHLVSFAGP